MKKICRIFTLSLLALFTAHAAHAQDSPNAGANSRAAAQQHLIGEVTAFEPSSAQLTIRTDAGSSVTIRVDEKTVYRRVPAGQASMDNAERITRSDVRVGDRVLVPAGLPGSSTPVRQLIVMTRDAAASQREQEREDWRRRGIVGRVVAVDSAKKELTVHLRGRGEDESIVVAVAGNTRLLRFAPDSVRPADAVAGSFADIRIGDQVRARGERASDGARFTADEIVSGSLTRLTGVISDIDAERGQVTVKNSQTGQTTTIALGRNTMLRRISVELSRAFEQRRELSERRRESTGAQAANQSAGRSDERGARGGGLQQAFESLPSVTASELKKGDAVIITGTTGADASRVTAVALLTGDAGFLQRLQQFLRGADGQRNMSTGLPGDVLGGGTGSTTNDRDQPQGRP